MNYNRIVNVLENDLGAHRFGPNLWVHRYGLPGDYHYYGYRYNDDDHTWDMAKDYISPLPTGYRGLHSVDNNVTDIDLYEYLSNSRDYHRDNNIPTKSDRDAVRYVWDKLATGTI